MSVDIRQFLKSYYKDSQPIIEKFLNTREKEAAKVSSITKDMIKRFQVLSQAGKRVRGALIMLAYQASGGKNQKAILEASTFIELFHTGILIHDDIMDEAKLRRGIPTIHEQYIKVGKKEKVKILPEQYGSSMAIDLGITAYYLSWQVLLNAKFPAENILNASKIYAEYIERLTYGQALDVTNGALKKIDRKAVLNVLKYKTAEYTGVLPLLLGAAFAGLKDKTKLQAFIDYGLAFGWAFQIQDDILGIFAEDEETGKDSLGDLREGKNTLLMVHLSKNGTPSDKSFLKKVLGNPKATSKDLRKVREMLTRVGSLEYAKKTGWDFVKKGDKAIQKFTKDKKLQDIFSSLLHFLMERTN